MKDDISLKPSIYQTPSTSSQQELIQTSSQQAPQSQIVENKSTTFEYGNNNFIHFLCCLYCFAYYFPYVLGFKKNMSRSIANMKYDIESINKRLDIIHSLLESMNDKLICTPVSMVNNIFEKYENDIICIDTNDDLEMMENKLTNDKQFRAHVVI